MTDTAAARTPSRGSASAELVICTPLLVLFALVAFAIGRLVLQQSQVVDVARSAAEAASVWPTPPQAGDAALLTASYELLHDDLQCLSPVVSVDAADLVPGGRVSVSVTCTVRLSSAALPGVPGYVTIRASATAPVEQYREVG